MPKDTKEIETKKGKTPWLVGLYYHHLSFYFYYFFDYS